MHVWVAGFSGGFEDGVGYPLYLAFWGSDVRDVFNHFLHAVSQQNISQFK
jgi:hypothetical protein